MKKGEFVYAMFNPEGELKQVIYSTFFLFGVRLTAIVVYIKSNEFLIKKIDHTINASMKTIYFI